MTETTQPRAAVPGSLWNRIRSDPVRAPEHIALAAAQRHGPAAEAWAAEKRRRFAHDGAELAEMAKRRHATLARFEGAATGVGGVITLVPDMVGLAWIQTRLVFFVAAAYGYDPRGARRHGQDDRRDLRGLEARARGGARDAAGEDARPARGAPDRGATDPVRRDRLQLGRQRAQHARARRPGDPLLRRLMRPTRPVIRPEPCLAFRTCWCGSSPKARR